ncbi:hypothetical protein H2198_009504 [Neophaeococcomyces mojaviensis]|uniref:Uncharacterized protein n=1 Tax=Neophaeococcomyces mojaviensis TaxID=3383035 RepID=A0ACC2ZU50_9EURO|nr:hypothetical protein H2198_009504 [Knufia sp. JES_112]
MISHDGGDGSKLSIENATGKFSLFEELKKRNRAIDAAWIFLPWEGVEAEMECVALKIFQPTQYGVPYGYSPVIARNAAKSNVGDEAMKKFVEATRKGYELAMKEPEAVVEVMRKQLPGKSEELLTTSQNGINEYYSDESQVVCVCCYLIIGQVIRPSSPLQDSKSEGSNLSVLEVVLAKES